MRLYVIRHTRVSVRSGICYGVSDVSLASTYREEWQELFSELKGLTIDSLYSSPSSRCLLMAEAIMEHVTWRRSRLIQKDERLMELNFGRWEGQTWEQIYSEPEGKKWFDDYINYSCPEGESFYEQYQRVSRFLEDLQRQHASDVIVICTHAGVIRAMMMYYERITTQDRKSVV